jgi:hypothetical protein
MTVCKGLQTIDALLHLGPFGDALTIALLYLSVVWKKLDVVDGGLNPEDLTKLVVDLDRGWAHAMPHARPLQAYFIPIAHFMFTVDLQSLAQKCGPIARLHGVHHGSRQGFIQIL